MARSDAFRWRDWRLTGGRPLRPSRQCACGRRFEPLLRGQRSCVECIDREVFLSLSAIRERAEPEPSEADRVRALASHELDHIATALKRQRRDLRHLLQRARQLQSVLAVLDAEEGLSTVRRLRGLLDEGRQPA